jgi:hypothetical protein
MASAKTSPIDHPELRRAIKTAPGESVTRKRGNLVNGAIAVGLDWLDLGRRLKVSCV